MGAHSRVLQSHHSPHRHPPPPAAANAAATSLTRRAANFLLQRGQRHPRPASERLQTALRQTADRVSPKLTTLGLTLENLEPFVAAQGADEMRHALALVDEIRREADLVLRVGHLAAEHAPPASVNALAVLEERCHHWGPLVEEMGVRLQCTTVAPPGRGAPWIRLDPVGMRRIMDAVIGGCLDAAPHGAHITVAARRRRRTVEIVATVDASSPPAPCAERADDFAYPGEFDLAASLVTARGGTFVQCRGAEGLGVTVVLPAGPTPRRRLVVRRPQRRAT